MTPLDVMLNIAVFAVIASLLRLTYQTVPTRKRAKPYKRYHMKDMKR